jgi:uncharacterized membrane protein YphA (DoxX/SURF4 family)
MLVRIVVGIIFVTEGVLKFMMPAALGAGRFAHIGFPFPSALAPLVGGVEIAAGAAVLFNFYAGDAAILLLCVIVTALVTTKIPILLQRPLGPFHAPKDLAVSGWLGFLHEARTDLAMLFCLVAILIDAGVRVGRTRKWYQR